MIFTLTPNPSVDRTLAISEIQFNSVLRTRNVRLDWGGKGFNVSRSLIQFGVESLAMGWVGGGSGKILADGLQSLGIKTDFVWVDEETRTNTMIIEEAGDWHIKVNEPGPPILQQDIDLLFLKVESYAKKGDIWVLSGSLPPDVPVDLYAKLIDLLKSRGAKVYLDANGVPLHLGCKMGPFLVKLNALEAGRFLEYEISDLEDAKRAALPFLRMGIDYFALTMDHSGFLLASQDKMVYAFPPKVSVRNTSGSNDALLAGIIYAHLHAYDMVEAARWAVATGSASIETEGVSEFEIERIKGILPEVQSRIINVM